MNYHMECEITRVTLNCSRTGKGGSISIRLQPTPDFVRKDGDIEKVILVGEGLEDVVPCALRDEFESWDFEISCAQQLTNFLIECKMHRCRVRIDAEVMGITRQEIIRLSVI